MIPAILATDGMHGVDAQAKNPSATELSPHTAELRLFAIAGLNTVRLLLARHVLMSDSPARGMVEAAALADAAGAAMDGTP